MAKRDRKELISYLKIAMIHIIKWISQPDNRSCSWQGSINHSQEKMENIRKENPSIPDNYIEENWDKTFSEALKKAEKEMKQKSKVTKLTWEQVFKTKYLLPPLTIIIALVIYQWIS